MHVPGDCSAHGGHKRVSDHLELGLQIAVRCHVGAGNKTWVLWKITKNSKLTSDVSSFLAWDYEVNCNTIIVRKPQMELPGT